MIDGTHIASQANHVANLESEWKKDGFLEALHVLM